MEDAMIVALYWERNEEAIPETAKKYGSYCIAISKNILGNREDAEECVNDTYLQAWNAMPPHRPGVLSVFLGKITRNLSFNRYQRSIAQKRGGGQTAIILDEIAEIVSDKDSVEQAVDSRELLAEIEAFLASLPRWKRQIFVRRYWYMDGISDIAREFAMKENHVSVTLSRLRDGLRRHLTERGFDL